MTVPRKKLRIIVFPPAIIPLLMLAVIGGLISLQLLTYARPAAIYYGYPLKGARILVDPGHGGIDPGAHHN